MIISLRDAFRNEQGKAESKMPAMIVVLIVIIAAYWTWKYGTLYYKDYMFKNDIQNALKYDPFKVHHRPSNQEQREVYLKIAQKYGITFPDNDRDQYLNVGEDKTGSYYTVDVRYKRVIKHLIGSPKVKYFQHRLVPE
jgi:hypothetical protein